MLEDKEIGLEDSIESPTHPKEELESDLAIELLATVTEPSSVEITGLESLGVFEGMSLFFDEVFRGIDRKMASFQVKPYLVNETKITIANKQNKLNFLRDAHTVLMVPQNYDNTFGGMMNYTSAVIRAPYMVSTMHTEARRFYMWIKDIIKTSKMGDDFRYSITDFDTLVEASELFLKETVKGKNIQQNRTIGEVYVNYEEMIATIHKYNLALNGFKARDIELLTKEVSAIYEITQLMLEKIKDNQITLPGDAIKDLEYTIEKFVKYINVTGAMCILLNELGAVMREQVKTVTKLIK